MRSNPRLCQTERMFGILGRADCLTALILRRPPVVALNWPSLAPMEDDRELQDPITTAGLMFSRVAMAAARVRDGQPSVNRDTPIVDRAVTWLKDAADWLRYAQLGGNQPTTPSFLATELAYEPWLTDGVTIDPAQVAELLTALADTLSTLISEPASSATAAQIYDTFETWAERARAMAGTNGDGVLVP